MGCASSSSSEKSCCPKRVPNPACSWSDENERGRGSSCKVRAVSCRRCYKAGKITRNPFFNFLREYRQRNCGMSILEIARAGGAIWSKMDSRQREPYCQLARAAPKTTRMRRKHRSHRRSVGDHRKPSKRRRKRRKKGRKCCK